ncbi:hypothetical protein AU106_gp211 [Sinorhizobium phage phiM9]|uniref:Uncharacterized protein n=1 Tax=Sinorhizobium phage phiM9 TaxID=1636182 RepID=A0A0F6R544_9CAUD|nr:hypothetical protein AU106_gp211 [Sinorhizobium phage phiM9]AKE44842.1 hypothetical protein Sm_phiM9_215 [Sinorhizobium phage phiM9]
MQMVSVNASLMNAAS